MNGRFGRRKRGDPIEVAHCRSGKSLDRLVLTAHILLAASKLFSVVCGKVVCGKGLKGLSVLRPVRTHEPSHM